VQSQGNDLRYMYDMCVCICKGGGRSHMDVIVLDQTRDYVKYDTGGLQYLFLFVFFWSNLLCFILYCSHLCKHYVVYTVNKVILYGIVLYCALFGRQSWVPTWRWGVHIRSMGVRGGYRPGI
jgi:hypothetical protein